jgi:hypothetical protein
MSNFDIAFADDIRDDDPLIAIGRIQLGEHTETFEAFVGYWPIERYRQSWIAELRRLTGDADSACLLTSVWGKPEEANFAQAWTLYRFGEVVRVQENLILFDQLDHDFDPDEPWKSIPSYAEFEDGERISEWRISLADIEEFLARATT